MGDTILWRYCAWLALFASPAIPIVFAWRRLPRDRGAGKAGSLNDLSVAAISLLWFLAAAANFRFVGPLYGMAHYAITGGNLAAVLVCAVFCLVTSYAPAARAARIATALACLGLAVEWTLLGIAYR